LDAYGVTSRLVDIGQTIERINVVCGGRSVGTYRLGRRASPYPFALTVPQCTTEGVLQMLLADEGVAIERGVECVDVQPDANGVTIGTADASLPNGAPGSVTRRRTDWLIACDGAASSVRSGLGIEFDGSTSTESFAVTDMLADLPFDRSEMHLHLRGRGGVHVLPMPVDGYVRLFLDRWPGPPGTSPDPAALADVAAERLGIEPFVAEHTRWSSSFVVHRRVARRFRIGHVLLVGDAAHACTPIGGQGLNLGVADAVAWVGVLASVMSGHTGCAALDEVAEVRRRAAIRTTWASWAAMRVNCLDGRAATARDVLARHTFGVSRRPVTAWLAGALD
ncbi:MAG: NAD(P)/FAD-dependent oxidoreductase, partial [Ilumatobacter sp.]